MTSHQSHRRDFLKATTAFAATAALPSRLVAAVRRPPNILLIMADDLGYECIGANGGSSYRTPVLDRMANAGMRFEHCYSLPLCTPSRVPLMTGIYNVRNYVEFAVLDRGQTTVAHLLKRAGYATCIAGKWQLGTEPDSPAHFGFDEACLWRHTRGRTDAQKHDTRYANPKLEINGKPVDFGNGEYGPDVTCDFIRDFIVRHRDRPFFAYHPMILPHCPLSPTPDSKDWNPKFLGEEACRDDARYFDDMVAYIDKIVGRFTATLGELGIAERTLVLFTGDNGTADFIRSVADGREFVGGKELTTDAGTHVPLIASWPGVIPPGRVCGDLVDFSDFLPTLCEAAGAAVPAALDIDGRSFLAQLKGQKGNPRDWTYSWFSKDGKTHSREWARNRHYKLYGSGEFYDLRRDALEKAPLLIDRLGPEERDAHALLRTALAKYRHARPAGLFGTGKPGKG